MLPDITVLWVIFFILVLSFILDRLIFRPVLGVIKRREEAVTSARLLAERATEEARQAGDEFQRKTAAARAEVYRQMDEMRRSRRADGAARSHAPGCRAHAGRSACTVAS